MGCRLGPTARYPNGSLWLVPNPSNKKLWIYFRSPIIRNNTCAVILVSWSNGSVGGGSVPRGGGTRQAKLANPLIRERSFLEGVRISPSAMTFFHWRIRFANTILLNILALRTVLVAVGRCTRKAAREAPRPPTGSDVTSAESQRGCPVEDTNKHSASRGSGNAPNCGHYQEPGYGGYQLQCVAGGCLPCGAPLLRYGGVANSTSTGTKQSEVPSCLSSEASRSEKCGQRGSRDG